MIPLNLNQAGWLMECRWVLFRTLEFMWQTVAAGLVQCLKVAFSLSYVVIAILLPGNKNTLEVKPTIPYRHPKSSSHTWWGSVWKEPQKKALLSVDVLGVQTDTDPHVRFDWMSRDSNHRNPQFWMIQKQLSSTWWGFVCFFGFVEWWTWRHPGV